MIQEGCGTQSHESLQPSGISPVSEAQMHWLLQNVREVVGLFVSSSLREKLWILLVEKRPGR